MDERRIVEILDTYFSSIYNYVYFHLLNQTAAEAYRQKNKEEIVGEEYFQDELLPALHLLPELTWEERGLIYLLYQDMTITERAEIQNITVSELLRREASIMERLAMTSLHQ